MTNETEKETSAAVDEEVIKAVAERLRFFFSNANVRSDGFMRQRLVEDDKKVPIEDLLRFNSIKKHTTDPAVVVQAAKTLSDVLVLDEEEKAIARVTPFTEDMMDDNIPLSLVVSNLPVTEPKDGKSVGKYAVTMQEVRALFEPYGNVVLCKLRYKPRDPNEDPKKKRRSEPLGAAFVEYETEEQQQKAAEELCTTKDGKKVEPKTKLTLGGKDLEVTTLRGWIDEEKKRKLSEEGDENAEQDKKRGREEEEETETTLEFEKFAIDWKPGCVIQIKGLAEKCDREAIRAAVAQCMGVTEKEILEKGIYADYSRGQPAGAIRFNEPSDAIGEIAVKLRDGDVQIAGAKVESATILEGDEETKYWKDFIEFKNKQIRHRAEVKAAKAAKKKKARNH